MTLRDQLGARLKQLREEQRLRAGIVSTHLKITPQYLHAVERGEYNPSMDLLEGFALLYQVDVADLFTFPAKDRLRHQARELIRFTHNVRLHLLLEAMEETAGITYQKIEELSSLKAKASSAK
jgi:transcriptional regulator with XRE-family HTH domain